MISSDMFLYNKVRYYRLKLGYTQSQLADRVGCSRNSIASIELHKSEPSASTALLLCICLRVPFHVLFYYEY